jgi:hypothetical protein
VQAADRCHDPVETFLIKLLMDGEADDVCPE